MKQLTPTTKWLYGSGDFGFSLTNTAIGAYFAIFLTDVVGVRPEFAALFVLLGGIWDALTDPIVGVLSDRTTSKLGRRRPFILFGSIPFGLLFLFIWIVPPGMGSTFRNIYYPLVLMLFQTCATIVNMPFLSLTPELTSDYDERNSLTSTRMIFSILASLLIFTIPIFVIGEFIPANSPKIFWVMAVTAVTSMLPYFFIGLFIREQGKAGNAEVRENPGLLKSLVIVFRNRAFRWAMLLLLFSWLAIEVVQALLIYFIKYRLHMPENADIIMGAVFVVALISLPAWDFLSQKTDKRTSFIAGVGFWLAMQVLLVLFTPSTPLWLILLISSFAGIGVGAVHVFSWSMIPDSIDVGDPDGKRQEGLYYSVVTFMRKLASKGTVFLILMVLGQSGYEANILQQSRSADTALAIMFGPLPAVLLILAIYSAYRYPVRRADINANINREHGNKT